MVVFVGGGASSLAGQEARCRCGSGFCEADTPTCSEVGGGCQLLGGGGEFKVGEVVGYGSIKSASRMNGAIVVFLDHTDKVNDVVEKGVIIKDTSTPVLPLVNPARKVTISNAPPFLKNDLLLKELSRYGQVMSPIKMVSLGCKSPLLKHVVCHRRQVFMVLKNNSAEINLSFNFNVDGFNYMVFATSETMKCFSCGAEGHLIRSCQKNILREQ